MLIYSACAEWIDCKSVFCDFENVLALCEWLNEFEKYKVWFQQKGFTSKLIHGFIKTTIRNHWKHNCCKPSVINTFLLNCDVDKRHGYSASNSLCVMTRSIILKNHKKTWTLIIYSWTYKFFIKFKICHKEQFDCSCYTSRLIQFFWNSK